MNKNYERLQNIVRFPERKFSDLGQYIRDNFKTYNKSTKVAKAISVGLVDLTKYILWLLRYTAFDNHLTRKLSEIYEELKQGKSEAEEKFKQFIRQHPVIISLVTNWIMLGCIFVVGEHVVDDVQEKIEEIKVEKAIEEERQHKFVAYLERMKTITPWLVADLIAKEGTGGIGRYNGKTKTFYPYKDQHGIWTIGYGSTVLKDGSKVTANTPPIGCEEAYELAKWHLEEGETYFFMFCYDVYSHHININTVNEAFCMGSLIYNGGTKLIENEDRNSKERNAMLRKLYKEYSYEVTDQQVLECFEKYPITSLTSIGESWLNGNSVDITADKLGNFMKEGGGIYWRRWLEAETLNGDINPSILLDCPIDGMPEFYKYAGASKESFWIEDSDGNRHVKRDVSKLLKNWLTNPVNEKGESLKHWGTINDLLPDYVKDACKNGICEIPSKAPRTEKQEQVEKKTYVIGYEELYNLALNEYQNGNYERAKVQYEHLVNTYPNNALLRNDLAVVYNKLGMYDSAIIQSREVVKRIGDKSQYGAAQYNAGFAYEQQGNLQKALANYKLALANGNKVAQKSITRVTEKMKYDNFKAQSFIDAKQQLKIKMKTNSTLLSNGYNRA